MGKSKGEGPYHNNPHKDGPEGGNNMRMVQPVATSVSQGSNHSHEIDEASGDGMAKKMPK
jgi:hypothetical protein